MKDAALVLGGAVLGGLIGHVAFGWLLNQGFYGLVLPGGLLGLGAGLATGRSRWPAVVCGVLALLLGLLTEWRFRPFNADASLGYFLTHLQQLKSVTWLMLTAGTAIGFWVPFRRIEADRVVAPSRANTNS
jgi:hypothetical protein